MQITHSGIYLIRNLINNKVYIGQSCNIKRRLYLHLSGYGSKIIAKAVIKYGKENFSLEVLELINDYSILNDREFYWLNFYESYKPEKGYNLDKSPLNKYNVRGNKFTPEQKEKLKAVSPERTGKKNGMFNKHHTLDTKQKLKEKMSGVNNPFFGKHHSAETKLKMSKNHARLSGKNNSMFGQTVSEAIKAKSKETKIKNGTFCKSVIQFDKDHNILQQWESAREAQKVGRFNEQCINLCCRGKQKTHKGSIWEYAE